MSISDSLYCEAAAIEKHLPDVTELVRAPTPGMAHMNRTRRPYQDEVDVYSFPQGWGSTALGFGGVGGQAITTAQTTVVVCQPAAAVYFGRRLAYVIKNINSRFMSDVAAWNMADVRHHSKYEAKS